MSSVIAVLLLLINVDRAISFVATNSRRYRHLKQMQTHNSNNNNNNDNDFELLKSYHLGNWYGIQTGYDPLDDLVEDYMYSYNNYDPIYSDVNSINNDNTKISSIRHSTSLVLGEIRADCEVCFDSERLKTKEVGTYTVNEKDKLHKYLYFSTIKGPGVTRNSGMSIEIGMRSLLCDRNVRILLAYKPIMYRDIENSKYQIPAGMGLTDIIITREKLNNRPLKLDDNPDCMWKDTYNQIFDTANNNKYNGRQHVYGGNSCSEINKIENRELLSLTSIKTADAYVYRRVFPGGIVVEADSTFEYDKSGQVRIIWVPNHAENDQQALFQCVDVEFKALDKYVIEGNNVKILPPSLVRYSVEEFK